MSIIKIKRNFNINELETAMMDNLQEGELGYIGGQYNNLYIGTPNGQKLLNPITEERFNQLQSKANATNIYYGKCSTDADIAAKTVTVDSNFVLKEGVTVIIYFTKSNTASSPTLNVNSKGAKPIYRYGTTKVSTATTTTGWTAGAVQMFTYNGTGWVRDYWSNTTYSEFKPSGESAAKGLVPAPPTAAGITKYLREDATWAELPKLLLNNENNKLQLLQQINDGAQTLLSETNTSVYWANVTDFNTEEQTLTLDKSGADIIAAYQSNCTVGIKGTIDGVNLTLPLVLSTEEIEGDLDSISMAIFAGFVLIPGSDSPMIAAVGIMGNSSTQGMFSMEPIASSTILSDHINDTSNPHSVTKNQVGLGNVENKSSATIRSEITESNIINALSFSPAGSESAGGPANSVKANLKFGSKTYNGSAEQEITAADLNLTSPMVYRGSIATLPSTADAGDVYTKDSIEYVWSGTAWVELGDSSSFALKTVEVVAGEGLTGGGALTGNVTLSLENDYAGGTKVTFNGTDKGANVASFYAPEDSGSANQVLISSGDKKAPEWTAQSSLEAGTAETFAESAEIKLTGDVEGSVSSTHGWEIKTVANQAAKWTDAIGVKIQDADKTNTGEEVDMDGADDVTILLPSTIKASLTGNASTASAFHDKADITLKGDVTGTASSTHGWEITTELPNRLKKTQANNEKLNDANDALSSGFHYISGATANRPAFAQASDHTGNDYRIWTTAHSDNWLQQIATDFRCNDLFYRRRDNGTWKPWVQIQTTESADGRYAQLAASNTFTNGHIYLGGVASNSKDNKTQLVFGTSAANHIALSSNDKCLILNPTTGTTDNQICLYVNGTTQSVFPKGIAATSSGALPKLGSETRGATNHPVFLDAGEIKAVTLVDTANAMLNSLSAGSSVPEDNDYYISQYVNGGNTTTTYHRRPVSKLYDYMKNKLQGDNVVLEKPIKAYTTLAHNATTNDGRTGYHLIEINSTDNWMLTFTVRLYQGYNYTDIVVSGYNYTGSTKTWHDPKATIIGTHDTQSLNVVFGNSADCKCWVAIPAGNYYGIDVINVTNGYTQIADWTDVFKLSYVASVPTSAKTAVTKTAYAPWYRDETIPVAHGGTGVTTLAEGEAVIGNGAGNVTTRAIVNLTSKSGAGWTGTSSTASNLHLINRNTLAYWDGSYDGTASNISKLGTITSDLKVDGNGYFNGKNLFYATNNYNTHSAIKFVVGNATSAFAMGGDGLQTWAGAVTVSNNKITSAGTGTLTAARMYINYYGGNVDIGNPTTATANLADVFTVSKKNSVFRGTLTVDGAVTFNSTLTATGNITGAYIKGTWLQTTASTNLNAACSKIAVLDDSGWVYYRTPANILSDIGAVGTVNASGTAPLTLSASKSGTTVSITGSVATGTTSAVGVVKQHAAANCTSYSSDEGATTPLAVNKAVHKLSLVGDVSGSFAAGTTSDWSMDTTINKALHIGNGSNYIAYPGGGQSTGHNDGVTGYLTIQLPAAAWLQTTMVKFKVSIYNYSTHTSVDYIIGVYTYNSGEYLYNPTAICLGKKGEKLSNLPVRFGYQNNKYYIYIGESNTVWNYPNVTISDVTLGHSSDYNKWKEGWSISFGTTLASAIKHTITNTYIGYNAHNADYATSAGNADTVDGHHFHWDGQSGQPSWLWGGNDSTNMYVYNPSNFSVEKARVVQGNYTANGGQQNPNYFGVNKVGFLMMNTTVNGNSQYKDWIIMDCYSGNDVGGGVALGVNRQSLGAYIMRSDAARTSWAQSAELLHTSNYSSYAIGRKDANGYAGMAIGNADNVWIRTTTQGIIPYQSGGAGSGHQSLGTSSWYFSAAYIDNIYGYLNGNISGSSTSCSGDAVGLSQSGYGNGNLTYYQTSAAHASSEASWASYIICNHGNGSNYYNQTIRMPFWGPPQYSRMEGGVQKTWWTFLSTENYSSYALPLTGGTLSNNLYISATNKGYYLKDSTGYQYPGVYDNGSNLWLGSTQTAAQHHRGGTYISAGYNGTTGNSTIYVSVPNTTNNGGTNYAVYHKGYVPASLRYGNNPDNVGVAWVKDTNYFLRPANDDTIAESVNLGSTNHPWDNIYCEVLRATVSGKIEAVTTAGIHGQNDLYLTHTSGNHIYFGYGSESSVTVGMKYQQGSGLTLTTGNLITDVGYVNSAGAKIRSQPTYDGTTSYATNTYVGTTGLFSRTTNTSSRTIKHDIDVLKDNTLKADNLYNLPVHQFKYNDGILTDEEDARYQALLPGFIIEEMDEVYPIAVDKPVEDVKQWSWNAQYLIPPMLQLIQDQKTQLDKQQAEIDELKELVNKLLEKLS